MPYDLVFGTDYYTQKLNHQADKYKPGDIFLTRNIGIDETENKTFGFWNHSAIYVGNGHIIEAQEGLGVIKVKETNFKARYPVYIALRHKTLDGQKAADFAQTLLGLPYRKISSIFVLPRRAETGLNCVSVIRLSYWEVLGRDPMWRFPDNVFYSADFVEIERKWDTNWTEPKDDYWGIISD